MRAGFIITAAGFGLRLGGRRPKQFLSLGGVPMLVRTIRAFEEGSLDGPVVVTVPPAYLQATAKLFARHLLTHCLSPVAGGRRRQDSVRAGFLALPPVDVVVIHDAARPFVTPRLIQACAEAAWESGAALSAVQPPDTVKESQDGTLVDRTLDRRRLWLAQTPQAFRREVLEAAYGGIDFDVEFTDEASLAEAAGFPVRIVPGDPANIKITSAADLCLARALLRRPVRQAGAGERSASR